MYNVKYLTLILSFFLSPLWFSFNIFNAENAHRSLFPKDETDRDIVYKNFIDLNVSSTFSFSRFCDLSPTDIDDAHLKGTFNALLKQNWMNETLKWIQYAKTWNQSIPSKYLFLSASVSLAIISLIESNHGLIFTKWVWKMFNSIKVQILNSNLIIEYFIRFRSIHSSHLLSI